LRDYCRRDRKSDNYFLPFMPQTTRWRFGEFTEGRYTMRGRRAKWFALLEMKKQEQVSLIRRMNSEWTIVLGIMALLSQ